MFYRHNIINMILSIAIINEFVQFTLECNCNILKKCIYIKMDGKFLDNAQ